MKNKTKFLSRILTAFLAVMLCVTALSIPALAYGGDAAEATGGLEPDTEETEPAGDTTDETEADADTAALIDEDAGASECGVPLARIPADSGLRRYSSFG